MFFHLYLFYTHAPVLFSFQRVLRVVGVTGSFYFVIVIVCLFLYRQACRYLLIYVNLFVLWINFQNRFI